MIFEYRAIPGNHEFDYGVERFRELAKIVNFPYISCNFEDLKADDTVFDAYVIREIGGKKIGFIGVTTPETIGQDGGIDTELITDWNQVDPEIIDAIAEERSVFEDVIAQYLSTMGEKVSDDYADRYGQERIHFVSA